MGNLLAIGTTNAKTIKNKRPSAIMYLAPHTQNSKGISVCAKASKGCAAACLYSKGRGKFNSVQTARMHKTERFLNDKQKFAEDLYIELIKLNNKAKKLGEQIAIRLNGTSDLDFVGIINRRCNVNILDELTNLVFYDYTKILGKVKKYKEYSNRYKITFSKSEENMDECVEALSIGSPVSVVFNRQKGQELPTEWNGYKVIDGDKADDLMLDNDGAYIIGLRFKGSKKDMQQAIESGFAVQV
jgi:hypothetical protein